MKVEPRANTIQASGIQLTKEMGINREGMGFIQNILRSQIYSDKITSLLREGLVNSRDSHVEAGKAHVPPHLYLPSKFCPTLRIKDEGISMSEETVLNLYCYFGASSKRESNLTSGFMGIGKVAMLAYTDSFNLIATLDGKRNTYNIYVDNNNLTQVARLASEDTDEPNGVELTMAVKDSDVQAFRDKAYALLRYFKVKPIVHGADFTYETNIPVIAGNDWRIFGSSHTSVAIMGDIGYPISNDFDNQDIINALSCGIEIDFPIGSLEVAASRESLSYSPKTKKALADKLTSIISEVTKELTAKFKSCATIFEAHKMFGSVFNMGANLYSLRNLVSSGIVFNGVKISSDSLGFDRVTDGSYSVKRYAKSWRGNKIKSSDTSYIDCDSSTTIVDNNIMIANGITNRVYKLVNASKKVYVVSYRDKAAKKAFIKSSGLLESEMVLLSTLPKVSLGNGSTYTKNAKHTSAVFVYDEAFAKTQTSSWRNHGKKSDYWTQETLDLKNDSGVYVILDGFEYAEKGGNMAFPKGLHSTLESLKAFGITPKVYGIKVKHEDAVRANPNMVLLWNYISRELTAYFDKNNISQKLANRVEYDSNRPDWLDFILKNGSKADPQSDFAQAAVTFAYMKCDKDKKELDAAVNWKDYIKTLEPEHNLGKLIAKVGKKYPLFEMISFYRDTKADAILDYVKMVG